MALAYAYTTQIPASFWKLQVTTDNLQELATYLAGLNGSNAAVVAGGIEWSYGALPTYNFRADVGNWVYSTQSAPTQAITEVGVSTTEPLLSGYQPLPAQQSVYTVTAS